MERSMANPASALPSRGRPILLFNAVVGEIVIEHDLDQVLEFDLWIEAERILGLGYIGPQDTVLRRAEQALTGLHVASGIEAGIGERFVHEVLNRVHFSRP